MLNTKVVLVKIPQEGFSISNELQNKELLTLASAILMVEKERIFKDKAIIESNTD